MRGLFACVAIWFMAGMAVGEDKIRIGLALPTLQEARWIRDKQSMEAKAAELGVELQIMVARGDQEQQNEQVDRLLNNDIDVLVLAPHDAEGAAAAVESAKRAGVPVISYDRLVLGACVDLYLSFDNERVGEMQGEWLAGHVPAGSYIIMSGAPTDSNSKMYLDGAMRRLQPLIDGGGITVLARQPVIDWQPANALKIVETTLAKAGNRVDAVLAPNDGTAGGVVAALEAAGLSGKAAVTGQDADAEAVRRIVAGSQSMTVFKDTRVLGRRRSSWRCIWPEARACRLKSATGRCMTARDMFPPCCSSRCAWIARTSNRW